VELDVRGVEVIVEWWMDGKVVLVPQVLEKGFLELVAYHSLSKVALVNLQCNLRDMDWKRCNSCKSNFVEVEMVVSLW
jgi:hypothetical protein